MNYSQFQLMNGKGQGCGGFYKLTQQRISASGRASCALPFGYTTHGNCGVTTTGQTVSEAITWQTIGKRHISKEHVHVRSG